jgi:hypothetical protein
LISDFEGAEMDGWFSGHGSELGRNSRGCSEERTKYHDNIGMRARFWWFDLISIPILLCITLTGIPNKSRTNLLAKM